MTPAQEPGPGGSDRILLIQPRWMGDVLLCTPAARAARRAFPDARIDFLTEPAGAAVLAGNPHLDEVLVARPGARARGALLREIRRRRFEIVVDFRSTGSTAQVAWLSGAGRRIGVRGRGPLNLAYTDLLPRPDSRLYIVRQKLALLQPLGVGEEDAGGLALEVHVPEADRAWAASVWEHMGVDGEGRVVVLSTVARDPLKQWGAERWAALADLLVVQGQRVLLTHGPGEADQVRRVTHAMRRGPWRIRGVDTPARLAALVRPADLWVGHDGGPKHVAVAVGVPTVSVIRAGLGPAWTDTSPGSPHRFVEGLGAARDPRGGLDALAVAEVAAAVRCALAERRGGGPWPVRS